MRWYCHFDDDNYVNIYKLLAELDRYDADTEGTHHVYLGKGTRGPARLKDVISGNEKSRVEFTFGTGGAGFCLTKYCICICMIE